MCTECLNCGSIWSLGTEEYDWQKCSACGWVCGDTEDDDEDDDDFFFDDDDDSNDPNDSRNL